MNILTYIVTMVTENPDNGFWEIDSGVFRCTSETKVKEYVRQLAKSPQLKQFKKWQISYSEIDQADLESVNLLRSDLRFENGKTFDQWWSDKKGQMAAAGIAERETVKQNPLMAIAERLVNEAVRLQRSMQIQEK